MEGKENNGRKTQYRGGNKQRKMKNEIRQQREIEKMVGEAKNNLLNEIKHHNCLKQNYIFQSDRNG